MKLWLTDFSLKRPWLVVFLVLLATVLLASQFPKVTFDNDPENMLAEDEHVRVFHDQVKDKYALYDFVVVGIVNESNQDGVFNVATLERIDDLTQQLLNLRQGPAGGARIDLPGEAPRTLNLQPESSFERLLNRAFNHDPNDLFDDQGRSVIIDRELIAPSVVDSLEQAELGSLKLEYLMEEVPTTREEALSLRDTALGNPLYAGTLVSEDGRAIALYLPIKAKTYSHNVANLVQVLTADWPAEDQVYITGLPVAEDTFGIEMLVQMATSAPLAGLMIFLLLLLFFRKPTLIVAPMVVAVVSVVCTMGLLIGLGFDVHIMSSMIAIFLMPIAVADSVHILSEFYDSYHRFGDKGKTVRQVIGHLFRPMLFTSLTTMAGFASLAMTPIPPVRVFGLHVAFGVGLAWLLSMTLIPAYIMLAVPESQLQSLSRPQGTQIRSGLLNRALEALGHFSSQRWRLIIAVTLLVVAVSVFGISLIQVNDNPVKWFTKNHRIRVADRVLNEHFGGTYTAYLTLRAVSPEGCNCDQRAEMMKNAAQERFGELYPAATERFIATLDELKQRYDTISTSDTRKVFVELVKRAEQLDQQTSQPWSRLAEEIYYLEPQGLDLATLKQGLNALDELPETVLDRFYSQLSAEAQLEGAALHEAALQIADRYAQASFAEFVYQMEAELTAPLFKQPRMLRYVDRLEDYVTGIEVVGKTNSAVDALKKAAYELNYREPPASADAARSKELDQRNKSFFAVPETASAVGQVFVQLEGTKKKDSLFHLVTRDYQEANLWFQLVSGDNQDMEQVVAKVDAFLQQNPPPTELHAEWAGLTYLNVVWQDKMVRGMINSLIGSFVVVMIMMMILFRSALFGVLAMLPLSVTITAIYGIIGLVGKDYDMPVAILSALTLGLSIDFAIHFLQRARDLQAECGSWQQASTQMFKEPAMAISRNAIVIAVGFTPLLVAPLVPYRTVGFFLATIMVVSWLATLFILPALLTPLRRLAFGEQTAPAKNDPKGD